MQNMFLVMYCMSLFVGAIAAPMAVWTAADAVICMMLLVNTTAVLILRRNVFEEHYAHIGKYSHKASKMRSRCRAGMKKEIPMSDTEIKRGSML